MASAATDDMNPAQSNAIQVIQAVSASVSIVSCIIMFYKIAIIVISLLLCFIKLLLL